MVVPYKIIEEGSNYQIRVFENYDPRELFWHRDKENRYIELIDGQIKIQFDNDIPRKININEKVFIEKMIYHRVISETPFKLKITFKG